MITEQASLSDVAAWLLGRLPADWTHEAPLVTLDRDELVVVVNVPAPTLPEGADESAKAEAAAGRVAAWREETRPARMTIAQEAQHRFGRTLSWGARLGERQAMFTHLAVPAMTRLRQPERIVLDTLVESGVARSRSDALQWCVRLVGQHSEQWLADLRAATDSVRTVREQGPAA